MLNHPISPPPGNVLATARNSHTPLLRQQAEPKAQNRQYDLRVRMLLLMEENMHQLRLVVFPMICRVYTSQVMQDFFHQPYFQAEWPGCPMDAIGMSS